MIIYYSGCGNSEFIAKSIADALNEQLVFIPEAQRENRFEYSLSEGEKVGFVYPIYSWRPPRLVENFVKNLRLNGEASYVWTAVTCGDNVGETENIFRKELKDIGLNLDAAFCFVMPNTYVNFMGMSVDREEVANEKIAKAKEKLPKVIEMIAAKKSFSDMIKGGLPRFKSNFIGKAFYRLLVSDKPFLSTDECVSCGTCVKVCPLQNITLEDGRPRWHGNCTTCNACYHHCPKHAIQYGKKTQGKGQYFLK
ncbi:MAG: EFR1 family ferrodoxin [Bacteroidales bacterium]|nr:EFR1 family ferrodoxin [Bacteroidales bacterium]